MNDPICLRIPSPDLQTEPGELMEEEVGHGEPEEEKLEERHSSEYSSDYNSDSGRMADLDKDYLQSETDSDADVDVPTR